MPPRNANALREQGEGGTPNSSQQIALSFDVPATVKPCASINSPREVRLLRTLLTLAEASREALDRAIGASNTPDVVFRLRAKGFTLPCDRREVVDRDGQVCRSGWYRLTPDDAIKARQTLDREAA